MSPRIALTTSVTSSSARSAKSVCGYSLNRIMTSAPRTRFSVRWQCGSCSAPITAFGPTIVAHARDQVALAVVIAERHHRAVQAEQHAVDRHRGAAAGRESRRACSRSRPARPAPTARPRSTSPRSARSLPAWRAAARPRAARCRACRGPDARPAWKYRVCSKVSRLVGIGENEFDLGRKRRGEDAHLAPIHSSLRSFPRKRVRTP